MKFEKRNSVKFEKTHVARRNMASARPNFEQDAEVSDVSLPKAPPLKLCSLMPNGHLMIPKDIREKWLSDPVRSALVKFQEFGYVILIRK